MDVRREVALFVDWEYLSEGIRQVYGLELSPALLIEKARKYGLVNIARVYADLDRLSPETLREMQIAGLTPVNARPHGVDGRTRSAALHLLMDLVEMVLDRSGIPTILLMSGDPDFLRVVTMARNRFGKDVVISGVPGHVAGDLIDAAAGHYDPLEIPGAERLGDELPAMASAAPPPSFVRRPAPPRPARREPLDRVDRLDRSGRPDRFERPERTDRVRPAFGRRATRVTRGPEPVRTRLPQPDVESEVGFDGPAEAPTPAWQRGKLAERAAEIQRMLAEKRAAGEPVPSSAYGASGWQVGDIVEGTVKSITDFGAFLDLGGVDALLHVSQMAWQHVRHPSQIVQPGERLRVRILEVDEASGRISVGLKQLSADPWLSAANRYEVGKLVRGRVSGVKEYGVFVELEPGIFGLLHVSNIFEQPWGHHPSERYYLDQEVEVAVSRIDPEMRRLAFVLPHQVGQLGASRDEEGAPAVMPEALSAAVAVPAGVMDDDEAEAAMRFREGEEEA